MAPDDHRIASVDVDEAMRRPARNTADGRRAVVELVNDAAPPLDDGGRRVAGMDAAGLYHVSLHDHRRCDHRGPRVWARPAAGSS